MSVALLLLAVLAAVVLAGLAVEVVRVVRADGGARRTPPRSHHADAFDPRSRVA
jgi:hypothetical protein